MERLLGIEPRSYALELHCIIHYTIDAKIKANNGNVRIVAFTLDQT